MKMGRIPHIENLRITFLDGSDCLALKIPKEGILAKGWKIYPLHNPIVSLALFVIIFLNIKLRKSSYLKILSTRSAPVSTYLLYYNKHSYYTYPAWL